VLCDTLTAGEELDVLPSGGLVVASAAALDLARMRNLVERSSELTDQILVEACSGR
jgi:hypothetical protein